MIAQLSGRIAMLDVNSVVLDVNGVGYLVQMTGRTLARLGPVGGHVTLLTEMLVREDALTLFGFAEDDERQAFKLLQTVQGVGAKASLSILTALNPAELLQAIMAADKAMVSRADGIGPKLALRIVNELASKTGAIMSLGAPASLDSGAPAADAADNQIIQDALSALVNLGYARAEVFVAVQQAVAADKTADTSAIIGAALKQLGTV
jgi:Holliday junction DNA helicase RuvA